jgi:predicted DNA-binding protein (MmcQ/YjbR family)
MRSPENPDRIELYRRIDSPCMARRGSEIERAGEALRRFALGYPGTREEFPWGESAIKVGKKTFLFMRADESGLSLSTKLPESAEAARTMPFAEPTHYGLGKSGWITASFQPSDKPPLDLLRGWIDESYRAIAPKKLVSSLPAARRR